MTLMLRSSTSVALGLGSLDQGSGGIARVSRLICRVVGELAKKGSVTPSAWVLNDTKVVSDFGIPLHPLYGSRSRFALAMHLAAFRYPHFIYDFLGLARAHCRLPFLKPRFMAFLHGIEVWEGCSRNRIAAARRADLLVAISHYTRARAHAVYKCFSRSQVCWLSTEADDLPNSRPSFEGPPRVLIVSRIGPERYKGHEELIKCWPTVLKAIPRAILTIVGRGPDLEYYRDMASKLIPANRIEFRGFVAESCMDAVWRETHVFAMPSRGEGFGLVYIEAMRHGLPVIGSVHDAASEINVDGETGYNVNLDKEQELPSRIIALLQNPGPAAQMGISGQARWRKHFCYSAFQERFMPILEEFLLSI